MVSSHTMTSQLEFITGLREMRQHECAAAWMLLRVPLPRFLIGWPYRM
jgi:hypothetical protein